MKFTKTEKEILDILEVNGVINNLLDLYVAISEIPETLANIYIKNFTRKIKETYPKIKVEKVNNSINLLSV